jgi:hypothetical protein
VRRQRSAKRLGTRHDLHYFKQWTRWRKLRVALALLVPVLAIAWVIVQHANGESHPASSGPLSRAHAFIGNDCSACHANIVNGERKKGFVQHASDAACLTCHGAPKHQVQETFTPECASCHSEHRGPVTLARVEEVNCTQCHADLKTKNGMQRVARRVTSFNGDHPEFSALRAKDSDPGTIAFNHATHLKGVQGPDGKRVVPECTDCHRTGVDQSSSWRFAGVGFVPPASTPDRAYMVAPTYAGACAGCHDLRFDPNISASAPHDKPEVVYAFLQKTYSEARLPAPARPARLIPASSHLGAASPNEHLSVAARLLWGKTCKECHQLSFADGENLPTVAPSQITRIWLPKGRFNHESHRSFTCESCHAATKSQQTSEVLVPAIATCQTCHNGNPEKGGRSENRCFECHDYHDWKQQSTFRGQYDTNQLHRSRRN